MARAFLAICLGSCLLIGKSLPMAAQEREVKQPVVPGSVGSYDSSALRLEGYGSRARILKGADGTVVGRVGFFRTVKLANLVAPSERALREAREFDSNFRNANVMASVGLVVLAASMIAQSTTDINDWIVLGGTAGSAGLILYASHGLNRAFNALSKSLWWYNRDLAR